MLLGLYWLPNQKHAENEAAIVKMKRIRGQRYATSFRTFRGTFFPGFPPRDSSKSELIVLVFMEP